MTSKNLFELKDKVVVLVGASGLLGQQYSESLSEAGANVVLADLNFLNCRKLSKFSKSGLNLPST